MAYTRKQLDEIILEELMQVLMEKYAPEMLDEAKWDEEEPVKQPVKYNLPPIKNAASQIRALNHRLPKTFVHPRTKKVMKSNSYNVAWAQYLKAKAKKARKR